MPKTIPFNSTQANTIPFGSKPSVAASSPIPSPQPKSFADSIWQNLSQGATAFTNTIGLGPSVDYLGTVGANLAHPGLGAQGFIPQPTMKQAVGAGLQLGATAASVIASGSALGAVGAGALLGGAQGAGSSLASNESLKTAAEKGAVGAGAGAAISGTIAGVGKLLGIAGDKIMTTVIKPSKADIADGFSLDTIKKFNLGGSLNKTYTKTQSTLNDLTAQLNTKLANTTTEVNLQDVLKNTASDLTTQGGTFKNFGFNTKISGALQQLQDEVLSVGNKVNVPEAQLVKQSAGKLGAWTYGKPDPESSATEAVYNAFYRNLKTAIEQSSPDGVKEINQQISKLIPIQNALIRRMPVAERNAALSLTDIITLTAGTIHPSTFGLTLVNRLAKSGTAGNFLSKYVEGALRASAPIAGEIVGGATSTIVPPSLEGAPTALTQPIGSTSSNPNTPLMKHNEDGSISVGNGPAIDPLLGLGIEGKGAQAGLHAADLLKDALIQKLEQGAPSFRKAMAGNPAVEQEAQNLVKFLKGLKRTPTTDELNHALEVTRLMGHDVAPLVNDFLDQSQTIVKQLRDKFGRFTDQTE